MTLELIKAFETQLIKLKAAFIELTGRFLHCTSC